MFDYFYGAQAEQFSFYRVPKVLFTRDQFKDLSAEAKTLYGIMLDKLDLSVRNNWTDEQGRVYIIYTIEQIMRDLNCGNKKAGQLLQELEEKGGLIERKRQGLGRPNLIFVKNFICSVDNSGEGHFKKCQNDTSGSVLSTSPEVSKRHGINT
ncbi:MAG: replication initiator protein A, partial [Eubacterium sp.]